VTTSIHPYVTTLIHPTTASLPPERKIPANPGNDSPESQHFLETSTDDAVYSPLEHDNPNCEVRVAQHQALTQVPGQRRQKAPARR
jgi:hypothetical protein